MEFKRLLACVAVSFSRGYQQEGERSPFSESISSESKADSDVCLSLRLLFWSPIENGSVQAVTKLIGDKIFV